MSLCRSRFTTNGTGRKRVKGETSLKTLSYRKLGKTCQAVWVARQGSEWPKLLLLFSMWLQVQMRDKCDLWEQLTADRRQTWSSYDPNVVVLL